MRQRVISAIFFVIVMLGGIFGGFLPFAVLFLLITGGALWELTGLLFRPEGNHLLLRRVVGTVLGCLPFIGAVLIQHAPYVLFVDFGFLGIALEAGVGLLIAFFLLFIMELFLESRQPFTNMGHYLLGVFYLGIPFMLVIFIALDYGDHVAESRPDDQIYNPLRAFGVLLLTWTNDTLAYLVGSQIGKTKFFPRISPNKTWEGTLGGMICTFLIAWLFSLWMPVFTFREWMALAAVVAIFGTLGDLVESMLKRSLGVKDSGSIMPGHGGFLDRFDSFIFVLPFAWLVLVVL